MANPNYTLGRGKVYFARFITGQTPGPFRYIGNTPEFNLTIESETLDHFCSDEGIREKDDSVPLEVTRSGTIVCDDIQAENVALFFFGVTDVLTTVADTAIAEAFAAVLSDMHYQIGLTPSNPVGVRGVTNVVIKDNITPATVYVAGTDYVLDAARGMFHVVPGGAMVGKAVDITYDISGSTQERILSGSEPVEGAMRYLENNPRGVNRDMFLPFVKITPNGDLALKGDEWRQIPFSLEALKPGVGEAIYINGQPITT